jgi:hypothetical protein
MLCIHTMHDCRDQQKEVHLKAEVDAEAAHIAAGE